MRLGAAACALVIVAFFAVFAAIVSQRAMVAHPVATADPGPAEAATLSTNPSTGSPTLASAATRTVVQDVDPTATPVAPAPAAAAPAAAAQTPPPEPAQAFAQATPSTTPASASAAPSA